MPQLILQNLKKMLINAQQQFLSTVHRRNMILAKLVFKFTTCFEPQTSIVLQIKMTNVGSTKTTLSQHFTLPFFIKFSVFCLHFYLKLFANLLQIADY